ncbi:MAG: TIM barrel protein [Alphaproteobacteria bacterium]
MRELGDRVDLLAINTATFGYQWPIEKTIDLLAARRVGGIAPWRREIEDSGADVSAVARRIGDAGLVVTGYCRSRTLTGAAAAERGAAIDENRRALDVAAALGARCYVMVVGSVHAGGRDLAGARAQAFDGVAALLDHARDVGVSLALEPLHPMTAGDRSCLNTLAQALDWCDQPNEPSGQPGRNEVQTGLASCGATWVIRRNTSMTSGESRRSPRGRTSPDRRS